MATPASTGTNVSVNGPTPGFDEEKHERPATLSDTEVSDDDDDDHDDRTSSGRHRPRLATSTSHRTLSRTVSEVRDGIQNQRDAELGGGDDSIEKTTTGRAAGEEPDPNLVQWDGPEDPENPKYWPIRRKWAAVLCVSLFTLISPVASSMLAPVLPAIGKDLDIADPFQQALVLSIFVAAYALGPLVWGPLSELYGRVIIIQISNAWFLLFNLGCALAQKESQMIAFRFLAGIGGSAPLAIGGGILSDLFFPEQRGKAISVYSLMPLLGPALGPIVGAWIAVRTSWRWVFYSTTIACALIQIMGLFFLQETYAPTLLARKKARLLKESPGKPLHTEYDHPDRTFLQALTTALTRPFRLLATEFIVQILALYMMFLYGTIYLTLSSFPRLFSREYHESTGILSLNYISIALGFFAGAQIAAPLQDRIYAALKRRLSNGGPGRPEFRVPLMIPGSVLVPIGLLIYSWTAEAHTHWIWPNVGVAIYAAGTIVGFQCIQGYAVDSYPRYAASAVGAMTVLRSLAGFGFPLFAPTMYDHLGYGYGGTVLAGASIVLGVPGPFLLWKFGVRLRAKSKFS